MRTHHDGLLLGRSLRASRPVGFHGGGHGAPEAGDLLTYNGDGHIMTIAPTGTGKTSGPVITNALTHPGQLIVLDIKGEVYRVTARQRRKFGPVHVLDMRDDHQIEGSLNPIDLALLGGTDTEVIARSLAADLVFRTGNEKDPFWNDWAEMNIAAALMHAIDDLPPEKRTLRYIYGLFNSGDVKYNLAAMLDKKDVKSPSARAAFESLLEITDITFSGILSTTQQQLRFFGSDMVDRITATTSLDLDAMIAGAPMSLYLIVPPHRLRAYRPLLRALLSGLIMAFTHRKRVPKRRTLMLCDEIGNLGPIEAFVTAATLLRGWGVTLWTFWQNLAQLDLYKEDAKTLIDNAGVIQLFGARNYRMAQDFVNLVGGICADDIMQLAPDQQILLREGGRPARAGRIRYFEDALFQGLYDEHPMHPASPGNAR